MEMAVDNTFYITRKKNRNHSPIEPIQIKIKGIRKKDLSIAAKQAGFRDYDDYFQFHAKMLVGRDNNV